MNKKIIMCMVCVFLWASNSLFASTNVVRNTNTVVAVKNSPLDEAWVLSLNGVGATTTKNSTTAFGIEMGLGRTGKLLLPLEAGVRQSVTYASDIGTVASTKVYSDWTLFTYKKLDLFAGANIGASYGNTPFRWTMAPEAGMRFWLKNDVALVGRAEYPFGIEIDGVRNKNTLSYCLGLQMKF